ncbi:cobalamin B12-binding domain-containing protein [archaeon]|nr:cobalamin B12-binding domain-containing protein [archaeon]
MKILLIKPAADAKLYTYLKYLPPENPPIGLAYIASFLENHDFEVKILDLSIKRYDFARLTKYVQDYSPSVIGFTSTTPLILAVYKIIDNLKREFPNTKYVLGGPHPTALPEEGLEHADFVVRGEGEETFFELAKAIKNNQKYFSIKGLSFKHQKKFFHNPNRPPIQNLDLIPFPAWHLLDLKKYHYFGSRKNFTVNIFTSRGCPYNCVFCNKNIFGRSLRVRSNENILEEIDLLVNNFGETKINFSDDVFNMNREKTIKLCKEITRRNYDLTLFPQNGMRVDSIDKNMLDSFWDAGFEGLVFGVESGDQKILDKNNKGITLKQIEHAFKISKGYGFVRWGLFLMGLPGETKETVMKTINFAIKLNPNIAKFAVLVPYPGTKVYEIYKDKLKTNNWSDFSMWGKPVFEHENMTSEELWNLYAHATKKFYLRPSKISYFLKDGLSNPANLQNYFRTGLRILKMNK